MSWDADLRCECCERIMYSVNFTHNCNGMIEEAMRRAGLEVDENNPPFWVKLRADGSERGAWWQTLDGMPGDSGRAFLDTIIRKLEEEPSVYEAMNPPNGWGSYDSLLRVFRVMRDQAEMYPKGRWEISG